MQRQIKRRFIDDFNQPRRVGPASSKLHSQTKLRNNHYENNQRKKQISVNTDETHVTSQKSDISVAAVAVRGAMSFSDAPTAEVDQLNPQQAAINQTRVQKQKTKQAKIEEKLLIEVGDQMYQPSPEKLRQHQKVGTVSDHIHELQVRAMYSVVALLIGCVVGYRLKSHIIDWLVKPLGKQLFYTSPTGGFDFILKICMFFGFVVAVPVIVYNVLQFIAPVVPTNVTKKTGRVLITSSALALSGLLFAYYASLPAALHFLNAFSTGPVQSLITAQEYFNFVIIYLGGFAALFQMPLIFSFINKITPLKPAKLFDKQRVVILVSFIVAAILTPTPDPINQTLMALPIILLYQTSIVVVWRQNKRRPTRPEKKATLDLVMDY